MQRIDEVPAWRQLVELVGHPRDILKRGERAHNPLIGRALLFIAHLRAG